jgi:type IV pilus assembly protein PilM
MASKTGAVWAIDIGSNSLKALHLSAEGGAVEVIGFDNIRHSKILTGSGVTDAERDELIALSLRQFIQQNDLGKDDVVISVPSQNSFARFVNLPPVEQKRIPEIVKFEAAQQIPFDINDVQWDWQLMTETGSPENKVGIFAVKNEVVTSALAHFSRENVTVSYVQMAPMALYNYMLYDRADLGSSDNQAIVVLDIGAENTDLVVCTRSTVWQRCIPMGGNAFTKAISDAFKLNFEKAEKLKRTAAMSKYARQIFQAMRPVFTDLASEIQRSLGFYSSSNPDTKLSKIIALGGGTNMRGLLKYLQQTLRIPVERPDSFKKLAISSDVSAAKFHESVCDFGIVYGLALQGLDLARIESNLLPRSIARSMVWVGKAKHFTAAACVLLLVSVLCFARTIFDKANYSDKANRRGKISSIINTAKQTDKKLEAEKSKGPNYEAIIKREFDLFEYRNVVPLLTQSILSVLPNEKNNPEQGELYKAFGNGDVKTVRKTKRKERKQIFVTSMSVRFVDDIAAAKFGETDLQKGSSGPKKKSKAMPDGFMAMLGKAGPGPSYSPQTYSKKGEKSDPSTTGVVGNEAGFIVTISGYSPYKNIGELMDPVGVEDDQSKWGFITRLLHLETIVDGNSLFKLYKKSELEHCKLEKGAVDIEAEMPAGIGLADVRFGKSQRGRAESGEQILIDPMTKEIISKVTELDEQGRKKTDRFGNVVYKVNDHWFVLNVKLVLKGAPKGNSG